MCLELNSSFFRYHPVIETTEEVNLDTLLEKLKSKIVNGYSSVRQAFLVFDEVSDYCFIITHSIFFLVCLRLAWPCFTLLRQQF